MTKCEGAEGVDGRRDHCPHGDLTCPCQDGDLCHYEGDDPMMCPWSGLTGCDPTKVNHGEPSDG